MPLFIEEIWMPENSMMEWESFLTQLGCHKKSQVFCATVDKTFPTNWAGAAVARFLLLLLIKFNKLMLLLIRCGFGRTFPEFRIERIPDEPPSFQWRHQWFSIRLSDLRSDGMSEPTWIGSRLDLAVSFSFCVNEKLNLVWFSYGSGFSMAFLIVGGTTIEGWETSRETGLGNRPSSHFCGFLTIGNYQGRELRLPVSGSFWISHNYL